MPHRFERRLERVETMQEMVLKASGHLSRVGRPPGDHVKIRSDFIWSRIPADRDFSDRRIPEKSSRPSATKIMTPRGISLKFYLISLFEAQARGTATGRTPVNDLPIPGTKSATGWSDLIAVPSKDQSRGRVNQSLRDKKVRYLQSALKHLSTETVQLINLPFASSRAGRFEKFQLLHEGGIQKGTIAPNYTIPRSDEPCIRVPKEFFTKGWVHLLEDSEICFLLMLLHQKEIMNKNYGLKVDSDTRLAHYGIGRDSYSAHQTLSTFGLISVESSPDRDPQGRARFFDPYSLPGLHQFTIKEDALNQDAVRILKKSFSLKIKI